MDKKTGIKYELVQAIKEIADRNNGPTPQNLSEKEFCTLLLSALVEEER